MNDYKRRAGLPLIRRFEGCRLTAYLDAVGIPTIGWGETKGVKMGDKITQAQADDRLLTRYDEFQAKVVKLVTHRITDNQLGALVCFAYNVGVTAFAKSTLLKKLNAGDVKGAASEFLRWNKAGGKVLNGLTKRRVAERDLFLTD